MAIVPLSTYSSLQHYKLATAVLATLLIVLVLLVSLTIAYLATCKAIDWIQDYAALEQAYYVNNGVLRAFRGGDRQRRGQRRIRRGSEGSLSLSWD